MGDNNSNYETVADIRAKLLFNHTEDLDLSEEQRTVQHWLHAYTVPGYMDWFDPDDNNQFTDHGLIKIFSPPEDLVSAE